MEEDTRKVSLEMEQFAWLVLRAVNQTQTKGSAVRLAVPTDPEIEAQLASLPVAVTDEDLLSAEEYLERHGYLARAGITLTRGTYTITPAGLKWLERGSPQQLEPAGTVEEQQGRDSATGGSQEEPLEHFEGRGSGTGRGSLWRRIFGR